MLVFNEIYGDNKIIYMFLLFECKFRFLMKLINLLLVGLFVEGILFLRVYGLNYIYWLCLVEYC